MSDFKCPHCEEEIVISESELFYLYEEGTHDVSCPSCGGDILVQTEATYNFEVIEDED